MMTEFQCCLSYEQDEPCIGRPMWFFYNSFYGNWYYSCENPYHKPAIYEEIIQNVMTVGV